MMESPRPVYPNELYHYGVKGMHWGIRRYQPYPKGYSGSGKYLGKRKGKIGAYVANQWEEKEFAGDLDNYGIKPYKASMYSKPREQWQKVSNEEFRKMAFNKMSHKRYKQLKKEGKIKPGTVTVYSSFFNPEHYVPKKMNRDWVWDEYGEYRYVSPENEGYEKKKHKKSGTGRGHIGRMNLKQINKSTNNALSNYYNSKYTEDELRKKRNRNIALGAGAAALGTGIYLASRKMGAKSFNNALNSAAKDTNLAKRFTKNAANFTRGGKAALYSGLGGLAVGGIQAARMNRAIKDRKPNIKGVNDEADKKARRKKIARNIAIGTGVGLATGGLGYLAYRNRKKMLSGRLNGPSDNIVRNFEKAKTPNATRKLSIKDEIWTEGGVKRRRRWRLGRM